MSDSKQLPLTEIEGNLRAQLDASDQMLDIIIRITDKAKTANDRGVSPAIAPELHSLEGISKDLRRNAKMVAGAMVKSLSGKGAE